MSEGSLKPLLFNNCNYSVAAVMLLCDLDGNDCNLLDIPSAILHAMNIYNVYIIYINTHTHTHTHAYCIHVTYIYIYIYIHTYIHISKEEQ